MEPSEQASRSPGHPIAPIFLARWSPRSFLPQAVPKHTLMRLFEAARWSPSCYNEQPWRFVWAQDDAQHAAIARLLFAGNRSWAEHAPVLGIVFAKRTFTHNGKPNRFAGFDAGAASLALTLQAQDLDLGVRFLGGFEPAPSYATCGVDGNEFEAMAAFALGKRGPAERLPSDLRGKEQPSQRRPLQEIAFEGRMSS